MKDPRETRNNLIRNEPISIADDINPALVAESLAGIDAAEVWTQLQSAAMPLRADVFSHLPLENQLAVIQLMSRADIARLFTELPADDRVDIYKRLPEEIQESVLPGLAQAEREDIRRLASYAEGSAGSVMTSDYATLSPELTAAEAIEQLRRIAPDRETIYYAYVLDESRKLLGFVSLKDLILARRHDRVENLIHRDPIQVRVTDDQEEAARQIQRYDLLALPVVDDKDVLVGIITHDDALDIMTQEYTEDVEKLMAIGGLHDDSTYARTTVFGHFRRRAPWVAALAAVGMVSGFVVQRFEGLLQQLTILAAFMPMLADTGGNTGSQSAALVVRALALREITPKDTIRILLKELGVALLLAALLFTLAFFRVAITGSQELAGFTIWQVATAISLALALQVITSTLLGALLPMIVSAFKGDPAVVASPAITTVVDITGLLIYFTVVTVVLGVR